MLAMPVDNLLGKNFKCLKKKKEKIGIMNFNVLRFRRSWWVCKSAFSYAIKLIHKSMLT